MYVKIAEFDFVGECFHPENGFWMEEVEGYKVAIHCASSSEARMVLDQMAKFGQAELGAIGTQMVVVVGDDHPIWSTVVPA